MVIGYTQGTFDTLHFGHVRLLKNARAKCDYLIVGVNSDELVKNYKGVDTIVKENERAEIVNAIKYADEVHIVHSLDKLEKAQKFHFTILFIGDDWKGSERYNQTEEDLAKMNIRVEYLPYTAGISSTLVREHKNALENKEDD